MEHIVGIKIQEPHTEELVFITWGRIFHPVDSQKLLEVVRRHLSKFGIMPEAHLNIGSSLQDIKHHPYFYEALFEFAQKPIPDGQAYRAWQRKIQKMLLQGEEIYFLGRSDKKNQLSGTVTHGFWYNI